MSETELRNGYRVTSFSGCARAGEYAQSADVLEGVGRTRIVRSASESTTSESLQSAKTCLSVPQF
jgi:hypothetical protein